MTRAPHTEPLPFRDIDDIAAALREAGGRLTTPRRLVLEALFAADEPLSAEEIAGRRQLELTSVYRNLEHLEELGVVRHVHVGHGPGLYALASGHEYLVCESCGGVAVVDAARLERVRGAVRDEFGFEPRFSHFPLHGLCERCRGR
jgi:Fur family transcriptional regulator, ferric uptake regulator